MEQVEQSPPPDKTSQIRSMPAEARRFIENPADRPTLHVRWNPSNRHGMHRVFCFLSGLTEASLLAVNPDVGYVAMTGDELKTLIYELSTFGRVDFRETGEPFCPCRECMLLTTLQPIQRNDDLRERLKAADAELDKLWKQWICEHPPAPDHYWSFNVDGDGPFEWMKGESEFDEVS